MTTLKNIKASQLDYTNKRGAEVQISSGSEKWVNLVRYDVNGELEDLFIMRSKYAGMKPVNELLKFIAKLDVDLLTVTQENLDAIREQFCEMKADRAAKKIASFLRDVA